MGKKGDIVERKGGGLWGEIFCFFLSRVLHKVCINLNLNNGVYKLCFKSEIELVETTI